MTVALAQHRPTRSTRARAVLREARRWHPVELVPHLYYVTLGAILAGAGYPAWRIACLAIPAAAQQLGAWLLRGYDPRACARADAARCAWAAVAVQAGCLATSVLAVAVTGGIRSPMLVVLVTPYLAALLFAGDRRETRLLLAATALDACILALLPRSWTGPELPGAAQAGAAVVSVLGVGALLAPFHRATRAVRAALAQARGEMAADALCRARTLEQIGAKVAHELKNPLCAIKALVQLTARSTPGSVSQERLEVVEKEISRMQEILADYLSFTRPLQELRREPVELGPLVSEAIAVLAGRADDARVALCARGDAAVEADPRRIREAVLNLVANAIEASRPGGEVVVEVRPAGEVAEIVVRDTGRGMPAEVLRRLGTPFFTTRDDGAGLGVVLARSVVAQHGGSLHYESEVGRGTAAAITLPVSPTAPRCPDGPRAAR